MSLYGFECEEAKLLENGNTKYKLKDEMTLERETICFDVEKNIFVEYIENK